MCWVHKTIPTWYQKTAKYPEVFQICRWLMFHFYSAIFPLDGHFPLPPSRTWSSRWTGSMYMILERGRREKLGFPSSAWHRQWYINICVCSQGARLYKMPGWSHSCCLSAPAQGWYQAWKENGFVFPPSRTSFLPRFPISARHEWLISIHNTADRRMNTGDEASQCNLSSTTHHLWDLRWVALYPWDLVSSLVNGNHISN